MERPVLVRVARPSPPTQHLIAVIASFDADVEIGTEPTASVVGGRDDQLHAVGADVVERAVDADHAATFGPGPPSGTERRLLDRLRGVRPPERKNIESRRHREVARVDQQVPGRRAHGVVDVTRVRGDRADLRCGDRDLVGRREVLDVQTALPGGSPKRRVERRRVDRDEAVAVRMIGRDEGVIDQRDPRGDLPQLGDQAGHRRSNDRVALRCAASSSRIAERDEGIVEGVAVRLELIRGGVPGRRERSQFAGSCLNVTHRRASSIVA